MIRIFAAVALMIGAIAVPTPPAAAQDVLGGAIIGGVLGGVVGGAATGRAGGAAVGAAIGATTGAIIASEGQRRRNGYYYYRNNCYSRDSYGNYYRIHRRYC